jgi:hypothetical protein
MSAKRDNCKCGNLKPRVWTTCAHCAMNEKQYDPRIAPILTEYRECEKEIGAEATPERLLVQMAWNCWACRCTGKELAEIMDGFFRCFNRPAEQNFLWAALEEIRMRVARTRPSDDGKLTRLLSQKRLQR